jgi:ketol-acid reductoisomerase
MKGPRGVQLIIGLRKNLSGKAWTLARTIALAPGTGHRG